MAADILTDEEISELKDAFVKVIAIKFLH